ncbi:flagellar hook-basal body complex protein FliE [Aeromonas schubertii]|uniref:Flagellar hook-basal body complex protein FliE n=1 Tax=Aeromonas schubertii TaxID=652 RepID=A0ABS7V9T2_9GAMM|nr:flagellar hook-basal body complex protein FliE [Aeromonas schubertii]KUE80401.1 flagellar hook-basal body protein FliE [Aeromonas schubertii]MBZ6066159.1 flagellar hook-basal body complex protein FliE [Aeromonas schubertii]MBZ6071319.1 flagellar hook-basal body complex protein FliE [Aeromonas schubertii]QCG47663.1 flagellar hook-basal body complex protein FliE [Aeromonas schubertii]
MDINATNLLQEMQSLRVEAGNGLVTPPSQNVSSDFGVMLRQALNNVNELQGQANDLRTRFDSGDRSIDLSQVMIAAQKSSIAFDATVQVRNKVVEAYKTIMNMPV